ncbi:surfeit locus 1 family protein [Palleronia marisminoris]|uniref:SURF1-like protein n=1 Tax=Palleronia marisminoris TaxID=315423 RepID=A0A1Y5T3I2_9RHOB|nr:SURF1 family protein [Palleronia marisminoris]SFH15499.1 surfeit locus 1 family protein [Palleronia marisminoris]SLN54877.1 SURF1 family protein [Palleronia marisminoris]
MRWIGLAFIGLGGLAVLLALGFWQVSRLDQKMTLLNEIETGISAPPVDLPTDPQPEADRYLPVEATGRTTGAELHVLVSTRQTGAGYRIIAPFETGTRRVMVDLGVVPTAEKDPMRPAQKLTVAGNLHWPRETDRFTPEPERDRNIWFARDVDAMADALGTEPLLIVARELDPGLPDVMPLPVSIDNIPNDHLQYAITWFSIAALWAGMTVLLGWRMAGRTGRKA